MESSRAGKIEELNKGLAQVGELKEQDAFASGIYDERAGGIVEIIIEIINKSKQSQQLPVINGTNLFRS